ncbi:MAG: PDZ domain-containing protein [Flavobacteriales bacterium]|nr:PDZ domain-containing protein [Flavobacteriales bacterium]
MKSSVFQPVMFAIILVLGVYIGTNLNDGPLVVFDHSQTQGANKLVNVIEYIDDYYVDEVKKDEIIEHAIETVLEELDPHSYYISADEYRSVHERMEGNFEGIGVEFMIQRDTLMVVSALEGGPSFRAGIQPGDRIVKVEGEEISGEDLNNERVMELLKGEAGSVVHLSVERTGKSKLLEYDLTREPIPIYSVIADFTVSDDIGYVKIVRFARHTYEEFVEAVDALRDQGASKVILDLRGNGGGYLEPATRMVEEFLERNELIVYTKGRKSGEERMLSSRNGKYRDMDLVILIDQGSASASEVVAGALQDHDRSIIVGRRSFGKGLVQNEKPFSDESAIRLTVARYYTPTGRCIQKPYGDGIEYDDDYAQRYESGELMHRDSIHVADSLKYTTPGGRTVYGGGGIVPDVFVPLDTLGSSAYLSEVVYSGVVREFGFNFTDQHRESLLAYADFKQFDKEFRLSNADMKAFTDFAVDAGIPFREEEYKHSREVLEIRIKAQIAKNIFDDNAYYYVVLADDPEFDKALEVIRDYKRFFAAGLTLTEMEGHAQ